MEYSLAVRWRRMLARRVVITLIALGVLVLGIVQHDRLLIGFGVIGLIASVSLCALFLWSRRARRDAPRN